MNGIYLSFLFMYVEMRRMCRLVMYRFPLNSYIKRKYSARCLRIWKQIYGFRLMYKLFGKRYMTNLHIRLEIMLSYQQRRACLVLEGVPRT